VERVSFHAMGMGTCHLLPEEQGTGRVVSVKSLQRKIIEQAKCCLTLVLNPKSYAFLSKRYCKNSEFIRLPKFAVLR